MIRIRSDLESPIRHGEGPAATFSYLAIGIHVSIVVLSRTPLSLVTRQCSFWWTHILHLYFTTFRRSSLAQWLPIRLVTTGTDATRRESREDSQTVWPVYVQRLSLGWLFFCLHEAPRRIRASWTFLMSRLSRPLIPHWRLYTLRKPACRRSSLARRLPI